MAVPVECIILRNKYSNLTFSSKDLEKYRGRPVLIDETNMFNKKQQTTSPKEKPLRIKIEMYNPETNEEVERCNVAACKTQLDKLFREGKKPTVRVITEEENLHVSRLSENDDPIFVADDDTITLKIRPVCGCGHHDVKFFYFLVEIIDESNHVIFRAAFVSNVTDNARGASGDKSRDCTIPLTTIVQ